MAEPAALPLTGPPADQKPFGLLFVIVLIDMMGFGIIIPLMPFYALKFNASSLQVTMLLSVYAAFQFVAAPILGSLSDRVGRRPVLIVSQLGSSTASLCLGVVTAMHFQSPALGLGLVYLTRVIDGISGGNISAAQAYVSDIVPPAQRGKYLGMLGAAFGIGFALGPGLGGVLGRLDPALPAFVASAMSFTAATICYFRLPESLTAPVAHEPGSDLARSARLIKAPVLGQLCVLWFVVMFAFVTMEAVFPLLLHHKFGFGELGVGLTFMLAGFVIILVQGKLIGPMVRLVGEWQIAFYGPVIYAIAMLVFARMAFAPVLWIMLGGMVLNAFGRSMMGPALSALVANYAPAGRQGAAFGLFHGLGSLARVFGPALAGYLYDGGHARPFVFAAVLTISAAAWVLLLRSRDASGASAGNTDTAVDRPPAQTKLEMP
ncbi:MAG TPA: MFS transporter [Tepidisphaeraceae bacterium]|jgi:MFS family permease